MSAEPLWLRKGMIRRDESPESMLIPSFCHVRLCFVHLVNSSSPDTISPCTLNLNFPASKTIRKKKNSVVYEPPSLWHFVTEAQTSKSSISLTTQQYSDDYSLFKELPSSLFLWFPVHLFLVSFTHLPIFLTSKYLSSSSSLTWHSLPR